MPCGKKPSLHFDARALEAGNLRAACLLAGKCPPAAQLSWPVREQMSQFRAVKSDMMGALAHGSRRRNVNILEAVLHAQDGSAARLPLAATLVMGALAKQHAGQQGGGQDAAAASSTGGLLGMLTPFVDQNRDGSIVDDVLGQAGKLFGGR
jgi:phage tail protein X